MLLEAINNAAEEQAATDAAMALTCFVNDPICVADVSVAPRARNSRVKPVKPRAALTAPSAPVRRSLRNIQAAAAVDTIVEAPIGIARLISAPPVKAKASRCRAKVPSAQTAQRPTCNTQAAAVVNTTAEAPIGIFRLISAKTKAIRCRAKSAQTTPAAPLRRSLRQQRLQPN